MNLYEFSQINNNEMGIHVTKDQDPELYSSISEEVDRLLKISEEIRVTVKKVSAKAPSNTDNKPAEMKAEKLTDKRIGYCIRTGVEIPFNIEKPMTYDAYKAWSKYGDADYPENFCHFSGEPSHGETSVSKPILKKNWKKAKDIHGI